MRNGMTPLFTYDELEKWFDRFQSKAEDKMLVFLQVVTENFKEGDKGTDKTTGKYKGRRLAEEVSLSYTGGYVLVGVAGMEYAAAVEAKGYEVVSGANTQCEKYLRDTLKSIFSKI